MRAEPQSITKQSTLVTSLQTCRLPTMSITFRSLFDHIDVILSTKSTASRLYSGVHLNSVEKFLWRSWCLFRREAIKSIKSGKDCMAVLIHIKPSYSREPLHLLRLSESSRFRYFFSFVLGSNSLCRYNHILKAYLYVP